ncbi:hypothetical protein Mp_5g07910 [Marchantia polymorpha subsp. ruderalis]|uniref:Secreted protein n=2 Tax=Marchantia polymorpha TaxID=3197 RepID=A0AAF6BG23_MARPO|nr:hypothetical protein MARPO_0198s0010 [Marchantia polymorpha]BBN10957.1 hypothetical protein Mp_5g07910 [Marchantia polymorpha subsp. ruderalis]|eukprot:PTQ27442.1 hypothetical protein MARPO_0198s0010 [Marchantia polymorpha]
MLSLMIGGLVLIFPCFQSSELDGHGSIFCLEVRFLRWFPEFLSHVLVRRLNFLASNRCPSCRPSLQLSRCASIGPMLQISRRTAFQLGRF